MEPYEAVADWQERGYAIASVAERLRRRTPVQTPTPTQAGPGGNQPSASGGPRWGLAAVIVAVGLVVFLGVTRWLLAQPTQTPATSTPAPTAAATVVVLVAPTPAPTAPPVAAPASVPTATLRPVETAILQPVRTAAPAATPAGPTAVPTLAEAWWTRSSDQVDPQRAQLVLAALDRYWAVLTPAWRTLDTSHFDEVLVEPQLSIERQIFDDRRSKGRGVQVEADREYQQVRDIRADEAVAYEEYFNHGLEIDLKTGATIGEPSPKLLAAAYLFRKSTPGVWKVAEVITYDTPQTH
jgi:hypothetical protein